jgi:hypothetical protein
MEKENIEAKDKEFRDKLKKMRKNLAIRQVQADKNKSNSGVNFMIVIPILMVFVVTVYLAGKMIRVDQPDSPTVLYQSNNTEHRDFITPGETGSEENSEVTEKTNGSHSPVILAADSAENRSDVVIANEAPSSAGQESADDIDKEPHETAEVKSATPPTSSVGSLSRYGTRIAQNLVCSGVKGRNCDVPRSVFPLNKNQKPHAWMEVCSDSVPYKLKHVYYHEGRKYVEVPLQIEYRRMRTWSNINLKNSNFVGSWHVETVAEDGTILGRVDFKVTTGK